MIVLDVALKAGDSVRVGKGKTVWQIQQLWRQHPEGEQLATLHSGWNSTTVAADRLVRAERA
jgi:hypothetical protein